MQGQFLFDVLTVSSVPIIMPKIFLLVDKKLIIMLFALFEI